MPIRGKVELLIVKGQQRGARIPIEVGDYSVGAGIDNDIVLRDTSLGDTRFFLRRLDESLQVDVIHGSVQIEQRVYSAGQRCTLDFYQALIVAGSVLVLGDPDSDEWHSYSEDLDEIITYQETDTSVAVIQREAWRIPSFLCVGFLLVVGVVFTVGRFTRVEALPSPAEQLDHVKLLLEREKFSAIDAASNEQGLLLTGFVETYSDYQELHVLIGKQHRHAILDIAVGEKIITDVENIFRTHGVKTQVSIVDPRVVKVVSTESDSEKLEQIRRVVLDDVPEIQELLVSTEIPTTSSAETLERIVGEGKRIITVVSGELSYFVTSDQARYFIGSSLPSGYTVEAISSHTVEFSRNGDTVSLKI